jgi:exopolysaccharide production protein ExoQ
MGYEGVDQEENGMSVKVDGLRAAVSHLKAPPFDASHALALAALITPALTVLGPLGVSPLLVAASVAALLLGWRQRVWMRLPRGVWPVALAIIAWAAVSALWAVDPPRSLFSALQLGATTFAGATLVGTARGLEDGGRRRVGIALVAGLVVGFAVLALGLGTGLRFANVRLALVSENFEYWRTAIQVFNRSVTVMLLMGWIGILFLIGQGETKKSWALAALIAAFTLVSRTLAGKIGLVLGLVALVVRPARRGGFILASAMVLMVALIPVGAKLLPSPEETAAWMFIPNSSHHRLTIWSFAAQRIAERPVLGWGMDSSRSIPGGEDEVGLDIYSPQHHRSYPVLEQMMPLHPHNAVLQWWLELGGVGAALFVVFLWRLTRLSTDPALGERVNGVAVALVVGGFTISAVSYGFWQSWWQSSLWLLAAWMAAVAPLAAPEAKVRTEA